MALNPAYAHLAHRRAILEYLTNHLLENCVGVEGDPAISIPNPHGMGSEITVPQDELIHFIDQLRISTSRVEDEMNKFDFVRRPDDFSGSDFDSILNPGKAQPQAATSSKQKEQGKAQGNSKRNNRSKRRKPNSPATNS